MGANCRRGSCILVYNKVTGGKECVNDSQVVEQQYRGGKGENGVNGGQYKTCKVKGRDRERWKEKGKGFGKRT